MARNLIITVVYDDTYGDDGELIRQGYTEDVDAGPATAAQIAASDAQADRDGMGFISIDGDGDVVPSGAWHSDGLRTAYVEARPLDRSLDT